MKMVFQLRVTEKELKGLELRPELYVGIERAMKGQIDMLKRIAEQPVDGEIVTEAGIVVRQF